MGKEAKRHALSSTARRKTHAARARVLVGDAPRRLAPEDCARFRDQPAHRGLNQAAAGGGTFTYDGESRQITATLGPPLYSLFSYIYDGEGRRVKRGYYGNSTVYVYAADGKLAAEYRNGALLKEFIYAGGKLLAVESQNPAATSYITTDHLGSTRVVTNASGAVVSRHDYLPFGKEIPLSYSNRANVAGYIPAEQERILQRFSGKEVDPETGLEYFGARYFSGRQGRFTSPDNFLNDTTAADPQSWNLYAYVRNNPLRYLDPNGDKIYVGALSIAELQELLERLNATYGCSGCVTADQAGYLQVAISGLSRELLNATAYLTGAINSTDYFAQVEVVYNDSSVAFGQNRLRRGEVIWNGVRVNADLIRLDFGDDQDGPEGPEGTA